MHVNYINLVAKKQEVELPKDILDKFSNTTVVKRLSEYAKFDLTAQATPQIQTHNLIGKLFILNSGLDIWKMGKSLSKHQEFIIL